MSYLFPISFMLNTFAMTAILVGLGLAGKPTMAAEVGIIQGATLALFYTFSANARNLILNPSSRISIRSILMARLLLCAPLGIVAFYLSVYLANVGGALALALILRRCVEWVSELNLSEMEVRGHRKFAGKFIFVESILLFLALSWTLGDAPMPFLGLFLWALLPLLMSLGFIRQQVTAAGRLEDAWLQMLPHLGSTAMIGITVYVFRLLIMLIVGKETAGDLYTAFAIGGIMGSVFAHALGPSLVFHEVRSRERYFPAALKMCLFLWFVAGAALFLTAEFAMDALEWMRKSSFFWGATGLSMIGGVVMVFAQRIKLRLLQAYEGNNVYGPDVVMSILIVGSVPVLYLLLGKVALTTLYLVNSILALLFYSSSRSGLLLSKQHFGLSGRTCRGLIALLLFIPLFFQLSGNIFHEPTLSVFDSGGALKQVPLPVSLIACYGGILLLGGYKRAYLSLGVIFMTFVLMVMSSVISTQGQITEEKGKLLLLLQFIIPMCALVLGQVFEAGKENSFLFEKVFLCVLCLLLPVQLLLTWLQGQVLLSPSLYLFSIYQHLQYVPIVFVSGYLIALYSLWDSPKYKKLLFILAPVMGIYVACSASMVSLVALNGGVLGFVLYRWKCGSNKLLFVALILVIVTSGGYLNFAVNNSRYSGKFALVGLKTSGVKYEAVKALTPNLATRLYYWKYYAKNIVSGSKELMFGHPKPPDRSKYPSAHNYYLDFVYNFGVVAFLPLVTLIGYTIVMMYRGREAILASSSLLGLTVVVLLLLFVDNSLKVGLRQPYPGIISFFLWAVLLSRLTRFSAVEG